MANVQRGGEKERHWRVVLSRQASSGLSVRAFCRQEGLTESALYAWRRALGQREGQTSKASSFVPVVVTDRAAKDSSIAIELVSGHTLRLPASTPASWLAELITTLEARPAR